MLCVNDYEELPSSQASWMRKASLPRVLLAGVGLFVVSLVLLGGSPAEVPLAASLLDTAADDQVTYLPSFGVPKERQYSGYIPVNRRQTPGGIWYWFVEARDANADENTPIIMWLNGGPGASSMTGALSENGPYLLNQTDGTLYWNPNSWTNLGHMLIVDQPVGAGYSYTTGDDGYVNNLHEMAEDLYTAVTGVLDKHAQYAKNPFYISGESYAGKYIPAFAAYIHERNTNMGDRQDETRINLTGLAIGNGELNPLLQYASVPDYARAFGFIDQKQYDLAQAQIKDCAQHFDNNDLLAAYNTCQAMEDQIFAWAKLPFIYDVRLQTDAFGGLTGNLDKFLNAPAVKQAFHVGDHRWFQCDGQGPSSVGQPVPDHLMGDELLPIPPETIAMLLENYKVLFYNGQFDASSCNHLGTSRLLDNLQWKYAEDFQNNERVVWTHDSVTAGYVRHAGQMHYVIVLNSGHLVPTDQPQVALAMMDSWLNNKGFA